MTEAAKVKRITRTAVLKSLAKVVREKGADYRYLDDHEACTYTEGGKPSCLVGHVLIDLGVPTQRLVAMNTSRFRSLVAHGRLRGFEIDPVAIEILNDAQIFQDSGSTWGEARREANRTAKRLISS